VPYRVEEDPEVVPIAFWPSGRLGARGKYRGFSNIEVLDIQIEVKLLRHFIARPGRGDEVGSLLKSDAGRT
jgi:hypothetical protein